MDPLSINDSIIVIKEAKSDLSRFINAVRAAPPLLLAVSNELSQLDIVLEQVTTLDRSKDVHLETFARVDQHLAPLIQSLRALIKRLGEKTYQSAAPSVWKRKIMLRHEEAALSKLLEEIRFLVSYLKTSLAIDNMKQLALITNAMDAQISRLKLQKIEPIQSFSIQANSHRSTCDRDCDCQCHRLRLLRTPEMLLDFVGVLRIITIGNLWHICTTVNCVTRASIITLVYQFPSWFQLHTVHVQLVRSSGAKYISIRFARVLPSNSFSFSCAATGDIQGLELLMQQETSTPWDSDTNGDTLLHVAVRENQAAMCRFLLSNGADPRIPNSFNRSPADLALDRILTTKDEELRSVFDTELLDESILKRGFSILHRRILGFSTVNSKIESIVNVQNINALDIDGRSPLYWAIRRGDIHAASTLLDYGADPMSAANAISWTCRGDMEDAQSLKLLLQSGIDPDSHDLDGHTPLQACGIYGRGEEFLKVLLAYGAQIDLAYTGYYKEYTGVTALGFASLYAQGNTCHYLLSHGANPSCVDLLGRTPLHLAVDGNSKGPRRVDTLEILLSAGADPNVRDRSQKTPANYAMQIQDIDSLELLMRYNAHLVFPDVQGSEKNGFSILSWPIQKHWYDVVLFLLPRVSLYDTDPISGRTILHALSEAGDLRLLVLFENCIGQGAFPAGLRDYQGLVATDLAPPNEARQKVMELILRLEQRDEDFPNRKEDSEELLFWNAKEHFDAYYDLPDEELSSIDNEDCDNNIKLMGWHDQNIMRRLDKDIDDTDSGYGSGEGEDEPLVPSQSERFPQRKARKRFMVPTEVYLLETTKTGWSWTINTRGTISEILGAVFPPCLSFTLFRPIIVFANKFGLVFGSDMFQTFRSTLGVLKLTLRRASRPQLPAGHRRITWNCLCGEELYGDFPNQNPEAVQELSDILNIRHQPTNQHINKCSIDARMPINSAQQTSSGTATSTALTPSSRASSTSTYIGSTSDTSQETSITGDIADLQLTPSTLDSPLQPQPSVSRLTPKFIELCINTGQSYQSLGEIDVTRINTDLLFFAWVRKTYSEVRSGFRSRQRFSHFLVKPVAIRYVQFGLESRQKVHIFQVPSYPTEGDVRVEGKWHFEPCPPRPPPPMPSSAFIHYLRCKDVPKEVTEEYTHPSGMPFLDLWLSRLPKKLHESLQGTREPLAYGWGLHIIEGVDRVMVLWTMIVVLGICIGPVVAFVVLTKDIQGATGIGGLYVSVLTLLWMGMKISEHTED